MQTFNPEAGVPFRGYLSTCVDRHFNDRVSKRREQHLTDLDEVADDAARLAQDRLDNEEMAASVEAVLLDLLPDDRQRQRKIMAFRLRHLEGWSVEDIRRWLRVARANTVSQWIHRVRRAFAEEFPRRFPEYFSDQDTCDADSAAHALALRD